MNSKRILNTQEEHALSMVRTALPNIDQDLCIDMLEAVDWDPDGVVDALGGRENLPQRFGGDSHWPKLSEGRNTKRKTVTRSRLPSSEDEGYTNYGSLPLKHSRSTPIPSSDFRTHHPRSRSTPTFPSGSTKWVEKEEVPPSTEFLPHTSKRATHDMKMNCVDFFEPIDGEDWQQLNLDPSFINGLSSLYPGGVTDTMKKGVSIRIPPTLAFEIYKLILLNESYRRNVVSSEDTEPLEPEEDKLPPTPPADTYFETGFLQSISTLKLSDDRTQATSSCLDHLGAAGGMDEVESEVDPSESYNKYREEAYYHHTKRNEMKQKLFSIPRQVGSGAMTEHYRQLMQKHQRLMMEANEKAKLLILNASEMNKSDTILDLHKLYVHEAMHETQKFVQLWKQKMRGTGAKVILKIVTGKGNNSNANVARIRPTVISWLTSQHISHIAVEGMVIVTLVDENTRR